MSEFESDGDELALPRTQSGPNPQHLLITILGDYWRGHPEPIPSAGLVALLAAFGTSETGARSALSRLTARRVLEMSRQGRRTSYRLTPTVEELGSQTAERIFEFARHARDPDWQGEWTIVTFSVPESERHLRNALRTKLRWHGFAPMQDGVWVGARDFTPELEALLRETAGADIAVFAGRLAFPAANVAGARLGGAHLARLEERYAAYEAEFAPRLQAARGGRLSPVDAFVTRTLAIDTWRGLYRADPRLPLQLLRPDWPQPQAGQVFLELYDILGPAAESRCREILRAAGASDVEPRHFTSAAL